MSDIRSNDCQNERNKIAIITGGSRGIGAATARLFAKHGYKVAINFLINEARAQQVITEINQAGGQAITVKGDVSNEGDVVNLFKTVTDHWGPPTALINNAGILKPHTSVELMSAERINATLATNVTGSFLCSKYAVQAMAKKYGGAGGSIVNVSSVAASLGSPHEYVDYAASKAAVDTLTIGLAKEVADQGIRVNAVRPGIIYTELHASGGEPDRVDRLKNKVPMQRGGQADEVAKAIYWLASDQASYCTGTFIDVSGGR